MVTLSFQFLVSALVILVYFGIAFVQTGLRGNARQYGLLNATLYEVPCHHNTALCTTACFHQYRIVTSLCFC